MQNHHKKVELTSVRKCAKALGVDYSLLIKAVKLGQVPSVTLGKQPKVSIAATRSFIESRLSPHA